MPAYLFLVFTTIELGVSFSLIDAAEIDFGFLQLFCDFHQTSTRHTVGER